MVCPLFPLFFYLAILFRKHLREIAILAKHPLVDIVAGFAIVERLSVHSLAGDATGGVSFVSFMFSYLILYDGDWGGHFGSPFFDFQLLLTCKSIFIPLL